MPLLGVTSIEHRGLWRNMKASTITAARCLVPCALSLGHSSKSQRWSKCPYLEIRPCLVGMISKQIEQIILYRMDTILLSDENEHVHSVSHPQDRRQVDSMVLCVKQHKLGVTIRALPPMFL